MIAVLEAQEAITARQICGLDAEVVKIKSAISALGKDRTLIFAEQAKYEASIFYAEKEFAKAEQSYKDTKSLSDATTKSMKGLKSNLKRISAKIDRGEAALTARNNSIAVIEKQVRQIY